MCWTLRSGIMAALVVSSGMKNSAELDLRICSKVSGGILAKDTSEAVREGKLIYAKPCGRQWNYLHKTLHSRSKRFFPYFAHNTPLMC